MFIGESNDIFDDNVNLMTPLMIMMTMIIIIGHCCSLMIAFSKGHQGRCPAGFHLGRNGHHRLLHGREFNPASLQRGDSGSTDDEDGLMIMMCIIMKKIDKTMIESIL